jgi:hypothetical protein
MNTYPRLLELVGHHVAHFRDDLVKHDRAAIEAAPDLPYLHWTRATGTHLEFLHPADSPVFPPEGISIPYLFGHAGRVHIIGQLIVMANYWRDHGCLAIHFYNGRELEEINPQHACLIAEAHSHNVQAVWHWQYQPSNLRQRFAGA